MRRDVRRGISVVASLAATILALSTVGAEAEPLHTIALRSEVADSKVTRPTTASTRLITLPAEFQVPGPAARLGGPRFLDPLPELAWGFALSRTNTHTVAAGRLRLALLENDFGVYAAVPLGPGRRVRPGTYLLTVFGPAKRVIRSLDFPPGTSIGPSMPQPFGYFADHISETGTEVHPTTSITYTPTPTTFTLEGVVAKTDIGANYSANLTCLVPPDTQTCAGEATQAGGLLPGNSDASASANWTQPGVLPPGTYKRLFEATTGSLGAQAAGFWISLDSAVGVPEARAR